jgi:hypothetical protein
MKDWQQGIVTYLQEDEKGEKRPGLQSSLTMKRVSLELAGHWTCSLLLGIHLKGTVL